MFQPIGNCEVPANISGPMYVFITDDKQATKMAKSGMNSTMMGHMNSTGMMGHVSPSMMGHMMGMGEHHMNSTSGHVVAGPALVFVDNQPDLMGNLVRPGLNNMSSSGNGTVRAQSTMPATQTAAPSFAAPTTVTLVTGVFSRDFSHIIEF